MKKTLTIVMWLCCAAIAGFAQGNKRTPVDIQGNVSGTVYDKDSTSTLPSVSIGLYTKRDSVLVKSTMSDMNGKFSLDVKKSGAYYLELKFIGYKTKHVTPIYLSAEKPSMSIKKVVMKAKDNELNEVKVVAEAPLIEYSADKTTLNVNSNAVAQGGTALELLQLVPNINVNTDGTVQLRGSDKVKILMDGRPSMFNSLDQVPSEMLDKIEVMTNPSSKYEAEGTAGIINLITNKRKVKGYFVGGNVNVNSRGMFGGGVNASAKLGKFSFMTNYNARVSDVVGNTNDTIKYFSKPSDELLSTTTQTRSSKRHSLNQNIRMNMDYSFNEKTMLTFQAGMNFGNSNSSDTTLFNYRDIADKTNSQRYRGTHTDSKNFNTNFVLAFNKKFDAPGHELTAEISFNRNNGSSPNQIYNRDSVYAAQDIKNTNEGQGYNIKIDYERMISEKLRMEIGERTNLNHSVSDYDPSLLVGNQMLPETLLQNNFDFNRDIHSGYLIFTYPFTEKLSAKLGARYEHTHEYGTQLTDNTKMDTAYQNIYPSLFLTYKLSANQSLNLNYSRRFDRPNISMENPKVDKSNQMAWKVGNPNLRPEDINSIELKYNYNTKPIDVNSAIYYRRSTDGIVKSVTYNGPISVTSYINQQSGNYYGGEMSFQIKPYEWLRIGTSGNWNHSVMSSSVKDLNADNELTTWGLKLNAMFNQPNICNFQITGNYLGPRDRAQGHSDAVYYMDVAVRKNFFNRKLSLFARISDVFNTKKTNDLQTGYIGNSIRYTDLALGRETSRIFTFGLNFNFSNIKGGRKDGPGGDHGHGPGGGPGGQGGGGFGGGRD